MEESGTRIVHFKWYDGNSVRRFALTFSASADNFTILDTKIGEYYGLNNRLSDEAVCWIDPDGDYVVLDGNESLSEALYYSPKEVTLITTQLDDTEERGRERVGGRRRLNKRRRSRSKDKHPKSRRHPRRRHARPHSHSPGRRSRSLSSSSSSSSTSSSSSSSGAAHRRRAKRGKKFAKKLRKMHKKCPWNLPNDYGFVHLGTDAFSGPQPDEGPKQQRSSEHSQEPNNSEKERGHHKIPFSCAFGSFGCPPGFVPPPAPPHNSWGHLWGCFPPPPPHHPSHYRHHDRRSDSPEPEHSGHKVHNIEKKFDKMTVNNEE